MLTDVQRSQPARSTSSVRRAVLSFVLFVALALVAAPGCGRQKGGAGEGGAGAFPEVSTAPGASTYSFIHDGAKRTFMVHVPAGHHPGRSLIVVLHGGGGSAQQMFKQHPLEAEADARDAIVVAAQGTEIPDDPGSYEWNGQIQLDSGVDDVGYLRAILVGLTEQLGLDASRRYVAGFSGGASMAIRFAAESSDLIAAFATFAGKVGLAENGGPFEFPPAPSTPISVQMVYGTEDENFVGEVKGTIQATSAQAGIDWWVGALACASAPETTTEGLLTLHTYSGCKGGGVVRFVIVDGMKHMWPELPDDPMAGTAFQLDFFATQSKPVD